MARTATLDRPGVVRSLGIVMLAFILGAVYLTWAMFNQVFSSAVPVTVVSNGVGLQLNDNADVKLRGVIVGRVDGISSERGQALIHLAIDPDQQAVIPADVEALIVPKTLFGEKYVELQPVSTSAGSAIQAGAQIRQAALPTEVEDLLTDLDPLLSALNPADLSRLLTALSTALNGQGEAAGQSLQTLSVYLQKLSPKAPQLVRDITLLGQTAQTYGDAMPDIGETLRNAVVTGNTITGRQTQLRALFTDTAVFATSARGFLDQSGDEIITLAEDSEPTLDLLERYSPTLGCVLRSIDRLKPALDSTFRDHRAHVSMEFAPRSPRAYDSGDATQALPATGGSSDLRPTCATLPGTPYSARRPAPGMSAGVLSALGIEGSLGKTSPLPGSTASVAGTAGQREQVRAIVAGALGVEQDEVPDVAEALFAPALRGAEVSLG